MVTRIALLGPPGSGKGTQGARLRDELRIPHISSGDLLRAASAEGTTLGCEAKEFMDAGNLVPNGIVIGLIQERIQQDDCKGGYLLDGFPRTIEQARSLDEMLLNLDGKLDYVIALEVPVDELVRRLSGRRGCPDCHQLYQVEFNPPKSEGICDGCGATLVVRDDDKEDTVRQRLRVYVTETRPLLDFYGDADILMRIDGMGTPDDVMGRIQGGMRSGA